MLEDLCIFNWNTRSVFQTCPSNRTEQVWIGQHTNMKWHAYDTTGVILVSCCEPHMDWFIRDYRENKSW